MYWLVIEVQDELGLISLQEQYLDERLEKNPEEIVFYAELNTGPEEFYHNPMDYRQESRSRNVIDGKGDLLNIYDPPSCPVVGCDEEVSAVIRTPDKPAQYIHYRNNQEDLIHEGLII